MTNRTTNIIIITTIIFSLLAIIFVIPKLRNRMERTDFTREELETIYKTHYLEKGKTIGRNAMLRYLYENGKLKDSITIELGVELEIEDSLQNKMLKENE